ncbi:DUF4097 family beta strand repeat protein [candidate division KSB1 bacterium]|nr:DUF4097 family beta strand repeat protein [candidate division KSB1 bacterium]
MMKKQTIVLAALFIIGCSTGKYGPVNARTFNEPIEKSFDVSPGGTLVINSDIGSIDVDTGVSDKVEVLIEREIDASNERVKERVLEEMSLDFDHSGANVTITLDMPNNRGWFGDRNRVKIAYKVTVPQRYNVDLSTAGGSIKVANLDGSVDARSSGGSLSFGQIEGPVTGKTSGGNIKLQGCDGNAVINTSGGSIDIGEVNGAVEAKTSGGGINIRSAKASVLAKTSGGPIKVEQVDGEIDASTSGGAIKATITRQPQGDCRLSTSGGGIHITLASDVGVDLDARTSGGRVRTDFPITVQGELKPNELSGPINGGGPQLYLRTTGGGITVSKQ